jgi:thiol:disulfide interchange protein DsbC
MTFIRRVAGITLVWAAALMSPSGWAETKSTAPAAGLPAGSEKLMAELRKSIPNLPIESVTTTPLPGFFAIDISGGQTLYGSADGKYLLAGDLFEVAPGGVINLAESRRAVKRKALMAAESVDDMVVFSPAGQTKDYISVFTDVDCGYCRKLHQEMADINALGIEVRYLAYPRAGLGTPTASKIESAWCADNPNEALTALKTGLTIPSATCKNPIAHQYELGQKVGVTGTPAIVTSDGRLLPGYMPAAALAEAIGLE